MDTVAKKIVSVGMRKGFFRPGCVIYVSGIDSVIPRNSVVPNESILNYSEAGGTPVFDDRVFNRVFNREFRNLFEDSVIPQLKEKFNGEDNDYGFTISFSPNYRVLCITRTITAKEWIQLTQKEVLSSGVDSLVFFKQPKDIPKVCLKKWATEHHLTFASYSPPKLNNMFEIATQQSRESEKEGRHCDISQIVLNMLQSIVANGLYELIKETFSIIVKNFL